MLHFCARCEDHHIHLSEPTLYQDVSCAYMRAASPPVRSFPVILAPISKLEFTPLSFSLECRTAIAHLMWTKSPISTSSTKTQSTVTRPTSERKLWRLAEMSRPQLKKSSRPLAQRTLRREAEEKKLGGKRREKELSQRLSEKQPRRQD